MAAVCWSSSGQIERRLFLKWATDLLLLLAGFSLSAQKVLSTPRFCFFFLRGVERQEVI